MRADAVARLDTVVARAAAEPVDPAIRRSSPGVGNARSRLAGRRAERVRLKTQLLGPGHGFRQEGGRHDREHAGLGGVVKGYLETTGLLATWTRRAGPYSLLRASACPRGHSMQGVSAPVKKLPHQMQTCSRIRVTTALRRAGLAAISQTTKSSTAGTERRSPRSATGGGGVGKR